MNDELPVTTNAQWRDRGADEIDAASLSTPIMPGAEFIRSGHNRGGIRPTPITPGTGIRTGT